MRCYTYTACPIIILKALHVTDYPIHSTYNDKIRAYVTCKQQFMEYTQHQQHFSKDEIPHM